MLLTDKKLESSEIPELIMLENIRQLEKWGVQTRSPFEWLAYTTEELGELAEAISEHYYRGATRDAVVKEAIQVATLALKIAEMYLDKKENIK